MPTVTNRFGTYEYMPTLLEEFVEKLAEEWKAKLSDLSPGLTVTDGPMLFRKADTKRSSISYERYPSVNTIRMVQLFQGSEGYLENLTPLLFADTKPRIERVHLIKGIEEVSMRFRHDENFQKNEYMVYFFIPGVFNALSKAGIDNPAYHYKRDNALVERDFFGASDRRGDHSIEDMKYAFSVVGNYFRK
jgi:hypothetical protein